MGLKVAFSVKESRHEFLPESSVGLEETCMGGGQSMKCNHVHHIFKIHVNWYNSIYFNTKFTGATPFILSSARSVPAMLCA